MSPQADVVGVDVLAVLQRMEIDAAATRMHDHNAESEALVAAAAIANVAELIAAVTPLLSSLQDSINPYTATTPRAAMVFRAAAALAAVTPADGEGE